MRLFQQRCSLMMVVLLGSFLLGGLVSGSTPTKPKTPPPPLDRRNLVTAVDVDKKQVTIETMSTKGKAVFDIDDFTVITFHNETGKITDIRVGQQVFAYVQRDSHTLDSISVDVADPAPVAH